MSKLRQILYTFRNLKVTEAAVWHGSRACRATVLGPDCTAWEAGRLGARPALLGPARKSTDDDALDQAGNGRGEQHGRRQPPGYGLADLKRDTSQLTQNGFNGGDCIGDGRVLFRLDGTRFQRYSVGRQADLGGPGHGLRMFGIVHGNPSA